MTRRHSPHLEPRARARLLARGARQTSRRLITGVALLSAEALPAQVRADQSAPAAPAPAAAAQPTPAPREEVVVRGERPQVVNEVDRQSYFFGSDPDARTGLASDLLRKVPAIQVSSGGGVSLRGDARVTVLVDGKRPTNGNQAISTLTGAEIDHIEVITNPSAEFTAEGAAGIINIVTKRRSPLGLAGNLNGRITSRDRQVVSALGNLSNGRLTIKAAINAQRTALPAKVRSIYEFPQVATQTDRLRGVNRNARSDVTLRSLLGSKSAVSLQVITFRGARNSTNHFAYRTNETAISGETRAHANFRNDVVGAIFESKAFGDKLSINIDGRLEYKEAPYRSITSGQNGAASRDVFSQSLSQSGRADRFSSDFALNTGNQGQLKAGLFHSRDTSRSESMVSAMDGLGGFIFPTRSLSFDGSQTLSSSYVTWQRIVGPTTILPGVRLERQQLDLMSDGAFAQRSSLTVFPSLHLSHKLGKDELLKASYSKRISRPDIAEYNPGVRLQTANVTEVGNPDLRSPLTDSVEIEYLRSAKRTGFQVAGFVRRTNDVVEVISTLSLQGGILRRPINFGTTSSAGLSMELRHEFTPDLKASLGATLARVRVPTIDGGEKIFARNVANLTIDYRPNRSTDGKNGFQALISHTGREYGVQGFTDRVHRVDLSWVRAVSKDVDLTLTATDITNGQVQRTVVRSPTTSFSFVRQPFARSLQLGLAYRFKSGQR